MQESSLQPFARGDLFVAVTELNDPNDDHAGRGRIIQYDAAGHQKGLLYLRDTTHLVGGLKFDPRGVLWAFDSKEFVVLNIHSDGKVVRRTEFPRRPFSHVNFAADGTLLLGEHVVGSTIKPEIAARMHTKLPFMPGTDRFGDGHVWQFKPDGKLIKEYATQTHGGMGGFLGVTMSTLSPGATLARWSASSRGAGHPAVPKTWSSFTRGTTARSPSTRWVRWWKQRPVRRWCWSRCASAGRGKPETTRSSGRLQLDGATSGLPIGTRRLKATANSSTATASTSAPPAASCTRQLSPGR